MRLYAVMLAVCLATALGAHAMDDVDVLKTLKKEHPRLFLTDSGLQSLKRQAETDAVLQRYLKDVFSQADGYLEQTALTDNDKRYVNPLRRHVRLGISREALKRIPTLAFSWRWSGEQKYADKAIEEMLAVCAFKDWNPDPFLSTAEMCNAVGLGYDWLFHAMTPEQRATIRAAIVKKALTIRSQHVRERLQCENNWNMVCNSGLIVGALAIAETDPQYAETVIANAVKYMPNALKHYAPDGAWYEGPAYWGYATTYVAYGLDAMDTALGTTFGLDKSDGLDTAGLYPIYTVGTTGRFLCYGDAGPTRGAIPCMFWLADKYNNRIISNAEHKFLEQNPAEVHHLTWYVPPDKSADTVRALDYKFNGVVPLVFMRSGWTSPADLWVGVKAGDNSLTHGHLDLGNFEFENLGVRWATDLGGEWYSVPGYWDRREGGRRWTYWRVNTKSHNVPLIGGKGQRADAIARVVAFTSGTEEPYTEIDLTQAYRDRAENVLRKVSLTNNRTEMVVDDRFRLKKPAEVVWGMTTKADIEIVSEREVILTRDGKTMKLSAECNAKASFEEVKVEQKPKPYKSRTGVRRLHLLVPAAETEVAIKVRFTAVKED